MKTRLARSLLLAATFVAASSVSYALEGGFRSAPAREIPVPTADVSPAEQALIGAPLQPIWNDHPKDAAEWKKLIDARADAVAKTLPQLRVKLGVRVEPTKIAGVNAYIVTPA